MPRHCYRHPDKKAVYPKTDPIFCSLHCAAEDAVDLRTDGTPLEVSLDWCEVCEKWVDTVIDGCYICDSTHTCVECDEVYTPKEGCPHNPPITRKNREHYGWVSKP